MQQKINMANRMRLVAGWVLIIFVTTHQLIRYFRRPVTNCLRRPKGLRPDRPSLFAKAGGRRHSGIAWR